jgi:nucleoid-associated protein YgaU
VDRALAVSMLASAALGGGLSGIAAAGEPPPPVTIEVRDGRAIESFAPPALPEPAATTPPPPPTPVEHHVVAPGESLWTIAAAHAGAADVGGYWARVVELNRAALRSGNPNLIHPGEIVELPPP